MKGSWILLFLFAFLTQGVFVDAAEETAIEGRPFTLNSGVTKQEHDTVWWYFNDVLIAQINSKICLYDGEGGIFRDRLKENSETGSLTIMNIGPEHAGRYEARIYRMDTSGKTVSLPNKSECNRSKLTRGVTHHGETIKVLNLTVIDSGLSPAVPDSGLSPAVPDSGLSPAAVAVICVGVAVVLLLAVVGLKIYHRRGPKEIKKMSALLSPHETNRVEVA